MLRKRAIEDVGVSVAIVLFATLLFAPDVQAQMRTISWTRSPRTRTTRR